MTNVVMNVKWVRIPLFSTITEYSEKAVRCKITDGVVRLWFCFALALVMAGCANRGQQHFFETNQAAIEQSKNPTPSESRATVYFVRSKSLSNSMSANPIPPVFYAIDGVLLAYMPVGSHAVLSLEAGQHSFSCIPFVNHARAVQKYHLSSTYMVSPGETYYIDANKWPGSCGQPERLEPAAGREVVAKSQLVKLLHNRLSIDRFFANFLAIEQKRAAAKSAPTTANNFADVQSALPTSKQVSDFLEIIATVAVVALVVVGIGLGGAGNNSSAPSPSYALPPSIYQSTPAARLGDQVQTPSLRTSLGVATQVVGTASEKIITNASSGVRYTVTKDRISGTDGSHYQIAGSSILSSTGQTYQVIGNQVLSSDGRSCLITDNNVFCR
jgi:hypothetical protein